MRLSKLSLFCLSTRHTTLFFPRTYRMQAYKGHRNESIGLGLSKQIDQIPSIPRVSDGHVYSIDQKKVVTLDYTENRLR